MNDSRSVIERMVSVETELRGLREDRQRDIEDAKGSRHENANRWMVIAKQNEVIVTKLDTFAAAHAELKAEVKTHDERIRPLEAFRTLAGHIWATMWKVVVGGVAAFGFAVTNGDRVGSWLTKLAALLGATK